MEILPYVLGSLLALVVGTLLAVWLLPIWLTYILIGLVSAFLILLVLIQRGRGGGLAGAFGGAGGSSAFGTRAGDVFTRITIVTASAWIALNMGLVISVNAQSQQGQAVPGGEFLPEGVAGAGDATAPDSGFGGPGAAPTSDSGFGADDLGVPPDQGVEDAGADVSSPDAPVDLPPVFDGGQPPNADDADLNVDEPAAGSEPDSGTE